MQNMDEVGVVWTLIGIRQALRQAESDLPHHPYFKSLLHDSGVTE